MKLVGRRDASAVTQPGTLLSSKTPYFIQVCHCSDISIVANLDGEGAHGTNRRMLVVIQPMTHPLSSGDHALQAASKSPRATATGSLHQGLPL